MGDTTSCFASAEFKNLQKEWYRKLKEVGFEEIEDVESPREYLKSWHSTYFFTNFTVETFQMQESYYHLAKEFYWTYSGFQNDTEREIWRLHAEGHSRRKIEQLLVPPFHSLSASTIQIKLSRCKKIMQTRNWPVSSSKRKRNTRGDCDRSDEKPSEPDHCKVGPDYRSCSSA